MSGSSVVGAASLIEGIFKKVPNLKDKVVDKHKNEYEVVVSSMRAFLSKKLNKVEKRDEKEALNVLFKACTYNRDADADNKLRELLGFSKKLFYSNLEPSEGSEFFNHKKRKDRVRSDISKLQEMCIDEFCHSEESSNIDSNAAPRKIKKKDGTEEKHAARVWLVSTLNE